MSTPTEAPEVDQPDAPEAEEQTHGDQAPEGDATHGQGRRIARERREAAEARAEVAEARVAALLRREVERVAAAHLSQPGDVLDAALGGVTLDDLLDPETGEVDPEAVAEAAAAVAEARPGLAALRPRGDFDGGSRGGVVSRAASWSDVLRRRGPA